MITDLELGGVPLHLQRLAVAMKARGFSVAAVSLARPGPIGQRLREQGIVVGSCEAAGKLDLRVLHRLAAIFREIQPKLVHSLLFHANFASRWAGQAAGIPCERILCEIQTVEVERRWHLWVDRVTWDLCRYTIGNSPSVVEHLASRARVPRDRLRLIRGGIDVDAVAASRPASREALGLPAAGPIVFWAGRLDPVKGLDILIEAFVRVAPVHGAHLLLAGDGPLRKDLERRVARRAPRGSVRFLGPRGDVPSLLKLADVFAFPSRTEGLPNALLEAMAAGCAIVTTDVPGCRDLVAHEKEGLLVPFGDIDELAAALDRLLGDPPVRRALGERAQATVGQSWDWRSCVAGYAEAYREAMGACG